MFHFSENGNEKNEKIYESKNILYPAAIEENSNYLTSNSIIASNYQNGGMKNGNELFNEPKNMQKISFLNTDSITNQFIIDLKENNNWNNYINLVGVKFPSLSKRYVIKQ